jgi:hypothetical protein
MQIIMDKYIHPRIHVILARENNNGIIIRRGPLKRTAIIGWNRETDNFIVGQWLKGKIYHYRSDISPNGIYWIYFAMSAKNAKTWTVVAKTPYLKAIDFYLKNDAWNGGGIFTSNKEYWLNETIESKHIYHKKSNFKIRKEIYGNKNIIGEDPGVYFIRLQRDGWVKINETHEKLKHKFYFHKNINKSIILCKIFYAGIDHPIGKGCYYEEHKIINLKNNKEYEFPDWEWADIDKDRIVWAEHGKIKEGYIDKDCTINANELFDANNLKYTEIIAPY